MNPTVPLGDGGMYAPGPGITTRDVDIYRSRWIKDWVRIGVTERSAEEYADLLRGMARMNQGLDTWRAAGEPPRHEWPGTRDIHLGHDDMIEAALTLREWGDGIPQLWVEKVAMVLDDPRLMRMYDDCARCQDQAERRAALGDPPRQLPPRERPLPVRRGHLTLVSVVHEEGTR